LLEEYCELVYLAGIDAGRANHTKKLQAHLVKIENSVKAELIANKTEIAFLSYNAGMADSILSICFAAKADPACDAYWIPVPFYERRADGSFGVMHFEGEDCYDDGIECIDWQKYDIEARHPDVIFTFNPYDAGNYVTSVHPDFYCERLRGLTDLLVYVPYFVASDAVEGHFCTVAGCVHAHKVVLQSDKIRSVYIRAFKEAYGNRYGKPEDKFVALGSPKYDAIIKTKREDCRLPDVWRALIGNKKVVFYNTTVGAILTGNEQYLRKLRYVLDTFKRRDDVVLWWRPHPLNKATYKSMRPRLLVAYEQIVADYKRGNWGIFDDTADLHRAIAWSDAYYGDGSSVVSLFEKTRKQIVIQDVSAKYAFSETGAALPMTMCVAGESLYYYLYHRNAIYRLDLSTLTVKYHGCFVNKPIFGIKREYVLARIIDASMWFIPFEGESITVFDLDKNESKNLDLNLLTEHEMKGYGKFCEFVVFNSKVFLFPYLYSAIVCYDLVSGKTEHCLDLREIFPHPKLEKGDVRAFFYAFIQVNETTVLLPSARSNEVLEFNLQDYSYSLHKIGEESDMFVTMAEHDGNYWLVAINSPTAYKWNRQTKKTDVYDKFPNGLGNRVNGKNLLWVWRQRPVYKQFLFLFPNRANMVCRLDMDSGEIAKLDEFDKYCISDENEQDASLFGNSALYGNKIYICYRGKVFLEYDIDNRSVRESQEIASLSDADRQRLSEDYLKNFLNGNEPVNEKTDDASQQPNAGAKIYEYIKSLILTE
jgi:hypothetical protein